MPATPILGALLQADNGSASAPTITFRNSPLDGFFLKSVGTVGLAINGSEVASWNSTGPVVVGDIELSDGTVALPSLSFSSDATTGLFYNGSNGLKIGTNGTLAATIDSSQLMTLEKALTIKPTTNQLVLGTTRTITISASQPATSSRVYTIPDQGAAANFLMSAAAQTIAGVQTFSAAITVSAGITATATNDNAAAGIVGEVLSGSRLRSAATAASTGTSLNVLASALSLTAGDWDVSGAIGFLGATGTSITLLKAGISKTSATLPASDTMGVPTSGEVSSQISTAANIIGANDIVLQLQTTRISLSGTTNIFLVANATFSAAALTVYGSLNARRIR